MNVLKKQLNNAPLVLLAIVLGALAIFSMAFLSPFRTYYRGDMDLFVPYSIIIISWIAFATSFVLLFKKNKIAAVIIILIFLFSLFSIFFGMQ